MDFDVIVFGLPTLFIKADKTRSFQTSWATSGCVSFVELLLLPILEDKNGYDNEFFYKFDDR
jgi:hypothetical protein